MPQTRLPERPKPPTGEEMLADIAGADDTDVVFVTGQAVELADLTPGSPDSGSAEGGEKQLSQDAQTQAEKRESAQRAYHKAQEFLERVKTLQDAPATLEEQYTHLEELGKEMSKAISDLQESSNHFTKKKKKKR
ncbi:hypothetical protein BaRGS_00006224 [Batillaria attramentaria]|uniref:Uncharacterized protein n=1 Tax=Batillaria attramentaria TaxID=370345 RepID=A0ABD0LSX0_9CAEN